MALFDCDDIWYRYEFAPLRGVIHTHKCIYSSNHWNAIQDAYNSCDEIETPASRLEKVLQTNLFNKDLVKDPFQRQFNDFQKSQSNTNII